MILIDDAYLDYLGDIYVDLKRKGYMAFQSFEAFLWAVTQ
jgi:hypothetical protein